MTFAFLFITLIENVLYFLYSFCRFSTLYTSYTYVKSGCCESRSVCVCIIFSIKSPLQLQIKGISLESQGSCICLYFQILHLDCMHIRYEKIYIRVVLLMN